MVKSKKSLDGLNILEANGSDDKWRLKLDANENIYGVSNFVLNAVKNIDEKDIIQYPNYDKYLNKLSDIYGAKKENLILTNGKTEAIKTIIEAYIEEEEEFLTYNPINKAIQNILKSLNVKLKTIDYESDFVFNKERVFENITEKTKVFYFSTPNTVSGYLLRPSMVEMMVKDYPKILFVIDCSYINWANDVVLADYIDISKKYDNAVILKSYFSDFALGGLRFNVVFANEAVINELKKVHYNNVNSFALACAVAQDNDKNKLEENKKLNSKNKELLFQGLKEEGFLPYESEANFLLCNFFNYSDFYYQKFKKNGVLVKKFDKESYLSNFFRMTVPSEGGIKYILELVKKKNVLIMNTDGILFDIEKSYFSAIKKTVEILVKEKISSGRVFEARNMGNIGSDINLVSNIISDLYYDKSEAEITKTFKDVLYSIDEATSEAYIDNTSQILSNEELEEINEKYDIVLVSIHSKKEIKYLLEKFNISKYFSYIISSDDYKDKPKADSIDIFRVLKYCPYINIKFLASSVEDVLAGKDAEVDTIGVIAGNVDEVQSNKMTNNFKHLGARCIINDIKNLNDFLKTPEKAGQEEEQEAEELF